MISTDNYSVIPDWWREAAGLGFNQTKDKHILSQTTKYSVYPNLLWHVIYLSLVTTMNKTSIWILQAYT